MKTESGELDDLRVDKEEYSISEKLKEQNGVFSIKDIFLMMSQLTKSAQLFKKWSGNLEEVENNSSSET